MSRQLERDCLAKWKKTFEYYLSASGVTCEEEPKYESTMKALTTYFEPRKNVVFERHTFRQAVQSRDETVDEYCTRLRVIA